MMHGLQCGIWGPVIWTSPIGSGPSLNQEKVRDSQGGNRRQLLLERFKLEWGKEGVPPSLQSAGINTWSTGWLVPADKEGLEPERGVTQQGEKVFCIPEQVSVRCHGNRDLEGGRHEGSCHREPALASEEAVKASEQRADSKSTAALSIESQEGWRPES